MNFRPGDFALSAKSYKHRQQGKAEAVTGRAIAGEDRTFDFQSPNYQTGLFT
jgi:hypothetical protein